MANDDRAQDPVKPTEQRGGTTPGETEAREKGQWAATANEGVIPAELGGSDAPREDPGGGPGARQLGPGEDNWI